jgi:hypothetical protein
MRTPAPYRLFHYSVLFVLFLGAHESSAQRLLVRTATTSVLGEISRTYLQRVDIGVAPWDVSPVRLSGVAPVGDLLYLPRNRFAVSTSTAWGRNTVARGLDTLTIVSAVDAATFAEKESPQGISPKDWRFRAACVAPHPDPASEILVLLGAKRDTQGIRRGMLRALKVSNGATSLLGDWPLPGAPVDAAAVGAEGAVAILCDAPQSIRTAFQIRNLVTGDLLHTVRDIDAEKNVRFGIEPKGLAVTGDGRHVLVLTAGYALDEPGGKAASWLHVISAEDFTRRRAPVQVSGTPYSGSQSLYSIGPDACWVATREPGSDFAFATRIRVGEDAAAVEVAHPFVGLSSPLRVAPAPDGTAVAFGVDRQVEIWPTGSRAEFASKFDAQIRALSWTGEGLFAGEGGRVHALLLDTAEPYASRQLNTGRVEDFVLAPARTLHADDVDRDGWRTTREQMASTRADHPDTDGDGLSDARDPEPLRASPELHVPASLTFSAEGAGYELRAVTLPKPQGGPARWKVEHPPWMHVYPTDGTLPEDGIFYIGVNRNRYAAHKDTVVPTWRGIIRGTIHVSLTTGAQDVHALGSPTDVEVLVMPTRSAARRVLWLTGRESNAPFEALRRRLAAPPLFLSHQVESGAFLGDLHAYALVVLSAEAASEGAITPQAALDYIAEGGALLFVGAYLPGSENRPLASWLGAAGVHLNTSVTVSGQVGEVSPHPITRNWEGTRLQQACTVHVDDPNACLVSNDDQACLVAATRYGQGRLVVLASRTPLVEPVLSRPDASRAARDLTRWLLQAERDGGDWDADGLPNQLEDANHNDFIDPGETNPLLADSDGDGVLDGAEDRNRNGRVDEGETSALNPDSDGDGIRDGADVIGLPPRDAPHIDAVRPPESPAQGGMRVMLAGRNFSPTCDVWIGERRASRVDYMGATALMAVVPPMQASAMATMDVRVTDTATGLSGLLPGGFVYREQSAVRLSLQPDYSARQAQRGVLSVNLIPEGGVRVGRFGFRVVADTSSDFTLGAAEAGAVAKRARRDVVSRPDPTGGIWIDVSPGSGDGWSGEMVRVSWEAKVPLHTLGAITIELTGAWANAENDAALNVQANTVRVHWVPDAQLPNAGDAR